MQALHIYVILLSETHLKPHERLFIPNCHFYRTDGFPGINGGTAVAVRKGTPHNYVDLLPLLSIGATGVCIPIGNSEILLAAVHAWTDADITEPLSFRRMSLLADLNAKHPFLNSIVSNPSGAKLLNLLHIKEL
jgi:hypothetical protein